MLIKEELRKPVKAEKARECQFRDSIVQENKVDKIEVYTDECSNEIQNKKEEIDLESINVINLQAKKVDMEQFKDPNILWIYYLLKRDLLEGTETIVTTNKDQECLYRQRHRLRIINKLVFREYIDESENVNL